jgi:hypothetical protein
MFPHHLLISNRTTEKSTSPAHRIPKPQRRPSPGPPVSTPKLLLTTAEDPHRSNQHNSSLREKQSITCSSLWSRTIPQATRWRTPTHRSRTRPQSLHAPRAQATAINGCGIDLTPNWIRVELRENPNRAGRWRARRKPPAGAWGRVRGVAPQRREARAQPSKSTAGRGGYG